MDGAVVAIEAALEGPIGVILEGLGGLAWGDVPLTDGIVSVAGGVEDFGDGEALAVEISAIAWEMVIVDHVADASLVGVQAREERGAAGATAGGVIELGEADSVGGEGIEVRGGDFATETTEIGEAHIVGEDDDDIGAGGRLGKSV